MELSYAKFKDYPRMSRETIAFVGNLMYKGVYIAEVSNDGNGGPCRAHFFNPAIEKSVVAWVTTQQYTYAGKSYNHTMDSYLGDMASKAAQFARWTKQFKRCTFFIATDGKIRSVAHEYDRACANHILGKYPGAVILNEKPIQEALEIMWHKTARE